MEISNHTEFEMEGPMKRQWQIAWHILAIVLVLLLSTSAVSAAPASRSQQGWSSITVWTFIDNDRDGYITVGDRYLHEIGTCLTDKKKHTTYCGATDFGDAWWEPLVGGVFVTWVEQNDSDLPAGYKLNSITCWNSGTLSSGKTCTTRLRKGEAQFTQLPGALMNVYYGFVPEE